jgi:hypothetical protein
MYISRWKTSISEFVVAETFNRRSIEDPVLAGLGAQNSYNDTSPGIHGYAAERCGHYTMLHVEFDRERVLSSCIFLGTHVTFVGRRLVAAHARDNGLRCPPHKWVILYVIYW